MKIKEINPELLYTDYPNVFKLDFKEEANAFIENFSLEPKKYIQLNVNNMQEKDYPFSILETSQSYLHIQIDFQVDVISGKEIKLEIIYFPWMNQSTPTRLMKYSYSIQMLKNYSTCKTNQIFNSG